MNEPGILDPKAKGPLEQKNDGNMHEPKPEDPDVVPGNDNSLEQNNVNET